MNGVPTMHHAYLKFEVPTKNCESLFYSLGANFKFGVRFKVAGQGSQLHKSTKESLTINENSDLMEPLTHPPKTGYVII